MSHDVLHTVAGEITLAIVIALVITLWPARKRRGPWDKR
jgi:hypothetical protein